MDSYFDYIILSTNTNTNYIEYWQHVSNAYKLIHGVVPVCVFVYETKEELNKWYEVLKSQCPGCHMYALKAMAGIDSGNQAKLARMFIAGKFYENYRVVINDMDLLPLRHEWLQEKIESNWKPHSIMCIGSECYANTGDKGKFPMGNLTAYGGTISEIMNPNNLEWEDYIRQFIGMTQIDNKEDVTKKWYEFSDESVLRAMLVRWNQPHREIRVPLGHTYSISVREKSVCRSAMHLFDPVKLANHEYVEYHCAHPYNYEKIKPFMAYIENCYGK